MTETSEALVKKMKMSVPNVNNQTILEETNKVPSSDLFKEANEALQESNRIHVRPIVDESKLGIELFVGDKKDEFHGLIKTRYCDFIVHEIDMQGNIAQLTTLEAPEEEQKQCTINLTDHLDSNSIECLSQVNNGYLNEYKIDVTGLDKDARTSLHHAIKSAFDRLDSVTTTEVENKTMETNENKANAAKSIKTQQVDDNESSVVNKQNTDIGEQETKPTLERKYVVVKKRSKVSRPKNVWPKERPDHTHFILYKENKDTMDAIHNLAAAINTRPSNFSSAGTKDKRAVTTQWLSAWRLEPKRLIGACRRFNKRPFIKVGNFCFKKEPLKLGQLKANKFDIVIRHLVYNNDGAKVIEKAINSIKTEGFVNYFGLQRFGTRSIQTHEVGLAILQAKWDKAVDLILSYRFDDNMQPSSQQQTTSVIDKNSNIKNGNINDSVIQLDSRKLERHKNNDSKTWLNGAEQHNSFIDLWKSKLDAEIVFKKYPHFRFTNEGLIMKALSKSEDASRDYLNAIISLPRNTRSIYVHSYQSLLWNKLTTFRLKKHGFKVIPGDLILTPDANISDNSLDVLLLSDESETTLNSNNNQGEVKVDSIKAPIEEIESNILIATEENLTKYSIFDVVLPIIGSRVRLPKNDVEDELNRLLGLDNLTIDSFKAREKLFISYGSYRKIMVKPNNVNWKVKQYSNPQQNLIETDLELLNRLSSTKDRESYENPPSEPISDSSDEALVVGFELPPSSYATMCLREIMKKPSTDFNNKF